LLRCVLAWTVEIMGRSPTLLYIHQVMGVR